MRMSLPQAVGGPVRAGAFGSFFLSELGFVIVKDYI